MGGCAKGCLFVVLALVLWPFILAGAIAYLLFLGARALVRLWQSERPLLTKRLVTGALLYPSAAYFLVRYTSYRDLVKWAFVGLSVVATIALLSVPVTGLRLALGLGVVFAILFARASPPGRTAPMPASTPAQPVAVPTSDLRRLLEIEEAPSEAERALLLVREFDRLATELCGAAPLDREHWPDGTRLGALCQQVELLRASALDPPSLPAPEPGQESFAGLTEAISSLRAYAALVFELQQGAGSPAEGLRVLTRERGRIQRYQAQLREELSRAAH